MNNDFTKKGAKGLADSLGNLLDLFERKLPLRGSFPHIDKISKDK
jgi:hypothetical protein